MFKQQSLSFHVVSKTFITQINIQPISFTFHAFTAPVFKGYAHFQSRGNRGKHNFEDKTMWRKLF